MIDTTYYYKFIIEKVIFMIILYKMKMENTIMKFYG